MLSEVTLVVEGATDEIVARRILTHVGLSCGLVRGRMGKRDIIQNLAKYNQAARFSPYFVLLDLDHDADCAPEYITQLLTNPSSHLRLRLAVRALEAWLMADREHIAGYLGIPIENIPLYPDEEPDAKEALFRLVRRSRKTILKQDMLPRPESGARVGPGYLARIMEFLEHEHFAWRPDVAIKHSDSLCRCINNLDRWI